MHILFTGGGSGGHIYPIIAVKRALTNFIETRFSYLGPNGFTVGVLKEEDIKCKFILAGKLRRYFSLINIIDFLKIPVGFLQSLWYLFWLMPDVIFSKGGYGSIPVVFAGWLYRIPIVIHESDSVPGLANKILARFANKIIISFIETKKYFPSQKTILLGNPIRKELIQGNREEGIKLFEIKSKKPIILIIGGSQGAKKINEIILNTLPRLLNKYEIIHLCGQRNFKSISKEANKLLNKIDKNEAGLYHLRPSLNERELKQAYALATLIISRAGAGSIFEIAAIGKPVILIPLGSSASNHQAKNAYSLARAGGAVILEETNLTINMFLETIFKLLNNPLELKNLSEKVRLFYNPKTNQKIAEEILKLCQ